MEMGIDLTSGVVALLTCLFAIYSIIQGRNVDRVQEEFSKKTMDMLNDVDAKVKKDNERIVKEIESFCNNYSNINLSIDDVKKFSNIHEKYAEVIKVNYISDELIQMHHKQALLQSRVQFWFSLVASIVGFILLIIIMLSSNELQWYEYLIKTVPGIIIEAVSALFFSQSKETRERASDFLNRLREDRRIDRSMQIVNEIENEELKSIVKAEIALYLCGIEKIDVECLNTIGEKKYDLYSDVDNDVPQI